MKFSIAKTDSQCRARTGSINNDHGKIETPVFMPVGTVGAVKTFSPEELEYFNAEIILGNTYHLFLRPGIEIIHKAGGLHAFTSWQKPILTDSGGFQVFSLAKLNKISDDGVEFQSHIDGSRHLLSPEISMKIQRNLGADIIMAFDECPPGDSDLNTLQNAVDRTSNWMGRCVKWLQDNPSFYSYGQTIFPIIQGGINKSLRKKSIDELLPYAECGIAIGGLAVGEEKRAMMDTIEYCTEFLPSSQPRYLMGVGKPTDIIKAVRRGVDMFDCVMPTRSGRTGLAFTWGGRVNIRNSKYQNDDNPLDENCKNFNLNKYTKNYLNHLFNTNEILGSMLLTLHNINFYQELMSSIRNHIQNGTFDEFHDKYVDKL